MILCMYVLIFHFLNKIYLFVKYIYSDAGAGVYYLAEFVEEHTSITKKVIKWTIYVRSNFDLASYLEIF